MQKDLFTLGRLLFFPSPLFPYSCRSVNHRDCCSHKRECRCCWPSDRNRVIAVFFLQGKGKKKFQEIPSINGTPRTSRPKGVKYNREKKKVAVWKLSTDFTNTWNTGFHNGGTALCLSSLTNWPDFLYHQTSILVLPYSLFVFEMIKKRGKYFLKHSSEISADW